MKDRFLFVCCLLATAAAAAEVARYTGRHVMSMDPSTGQMQMNCEYEKRDGTRIWLFFAGMCPPSVAVR